MTAGAPTPSAPRRKYVRRRWPSTLTIGQPQPEELAARLRRFALFAALPKTALLALAGSARQRAYHAGELIWRQDEPNRRVLFIEEGLAITSRVVRDGLDRTYGFYGPGDSMGLFAIWAGMRYPTDARALNEGMMVIQLDTRAIVEMAREDPGMTEPLLEEIGRFTEAFIRKIDIVSAGTVARRVARLMDMLVKRYGVAMPDGGRRLPFRLTLEQIGAIVDNRFETVARVLSDWRREGWLNIDEDGFHFERLDRLEALLASDVRG
ncbi:MAG TPA: Crp/Fnr family transcriptional regulator [Thiobacillaceae bacterium]|nr:Crp/Fnr family transcriptional regulator [Thiobacillaceae bacterium]